MLAELDQLAERIQQLTQLTQQLRQESHDLRLRLTQVEGENRQLHAKLDQASQRVEAILQRLPQESSTEPSTLGGDD